MWEKQCTCIISFDIYTLCINTLNKIINAPCGTLKLILAFGVAKYIKSYKINFVVQYATDCSLAEMGTNVVYKSRQITILYNYKTISAHLGSPISCYINNLHGAFIFLLSIYINIIICYVPILSLDWQAFEPQCLSTLLSILASLEWVAFVWTNEHDEVNGCVSVVAPIAQAKLFTV